MSKRDEFDIPNYAINDHGTMGYALEMIVYPIVWLVMVPIRLLFWLLKL